jgi:hypothetical protein
MDFEMPDRPPEGSALRWLNRTLIGLCWVTAVMTVFYIVTFILNLVSFQYRYSGTAPSLGHIVTGVCGILAMGGITALFLLGLTKLTQIWAEVLDNGRQKTDLLAALLTDPPSDE